MIATLAWHAGRYDLWDKSLLTQHNLQLSINTYANTSANGELHQQLLQQLNMNAGLLPPPALVCSTADLAVHAVRDWACIQLSNDAAESASETDSNIRSICGAIMGINMSLEFQ